MRLKHIAVLLIAALAAALTASAQNTVRDFKPAADSLSVLVKEHTGVWTKLILKSVLKRGSELDFYFDKNLGDIPWKEGDIDWLRSRLRDLKPEGYGRYRIGNIYCDGIKAATLVTPSLGNSGKPDDSKWNTEDRGRSERPLVERVGALDFSKGLSSRYISPLGVAESPVPADRRRLLHPELRSSFPYPDAAQRWSLRNRPARNRHPDRRDSDG